MSQFLCIARHYKIVFYHHPMASIRNVSPCLLVMLPLFATRIQVAAHYCLARRGMSDMTQVSVNPGLPKFRAEKIRSDSNPGHLLERRACTTRQR